MNHSSMQSDHQETSPLIRPARIEDADQVIPLLYQAIGDIAYSLAGEADHEKAMQILQAFYVQENNRISYRHVTVMEQDRLIAGILVAYDGGEADRLDQPILDRPGRSLDEKYALVKETRPGEYYLDTLSVSEAYQGQGIGRALMAAFEQQGSDLGHSQVSLIVERDNGRALMLYERQGYVKDDVIVIAGHEYNHMVKPIQ
ncbi:ribosomal protein S18 acetylase RimI-like enzyme [Paenibacillus xylanexedens]|uniref:GNAT family N-acetyltransferase n=1 Tax=Paenibacillus xylanexedens TaxID=528191 RepID=UPI00209DBB54|nr:GNAT family N-acetyltransferase [Paenibacillus xylanexedens]MCP1424670.1 ribosomal protein S18 acetylase RimI-like enzyme [Paenibacillus xylanexedens]